MVRSSYNPCRAARVPGSFIGSINTNLVVFRMASPIGYCCCCRAVIDFHPRVRLAGMGCPAPGVRLLRETACVRDDGADGARRGPAQRLPRRAPAPRDVRSQAFTLLEIIVTIVIVGIVLAMILPTIGFQRWSSIDAKSVSNLRSHAGIFSMYATDWKDHLPYFTDPNLATTQVTNPARNYTVDVPYWSAHFQWPVALADPYYEGDHRHASLYYPGAGLSRPGMSEPVVTSPYWYGCSFIGAPDYWNARTRVAGISQLRPNSLSDALYPASKMLLLEPYPTLQIFEPRQVRAGMAFLDGSASREPFGSPQPDSLSDGDAAGPINHQYPYPPTMHTTDGIRGRDKP